MQVTKTWPNIMARLIHPRKSDITDIVYQYRHQSKIKKHGFDISRKILLAGNSGTGKTMTVNAIANELRLSIYRLPVYQAGFTDCIALAGMIVDSAEYGDIILINLDETLLLLNHKEEEKKSAIKAILHHVNEAESKKLIFVETRTPQLIDPDDLQFFDTIIEYKLPSYRNRGVLIDQLTVAMVSDERDLDLDQLAERSEGFSHREIVNACKSAMISNIIDKRGYVCEISVSIEIGVMKGLKKDWRKNDIL